MASGQRSAGFLMYRLGQEGVEVFLVHPGGPFFAGKDDGFWGIPKGLVEPGEELLDVAAREFAEETGRAVEECRVCDELYFLGVVVQRGGKRVTAWGFEGDWPDGLEVCSNTFPLEWPRGSGRYVDVPEVDCGRFFGLEDARRKINPAQEPLLDRLLEMVRRNRRVAAPGRVSTTVIGRPIRCRPVAASDLSLAPSRGGGSGRTGGRSRRPGTTR